MSGKIFRSSGGTAALSSSLCSELQAFEVMEEGVCWRQSRQQTPSKT